ncbi:hypothetical protein JHK82_018873 [Glycine max]|nr:hypothetical protein JHK86_018894 [Glycine max]KAG5143178.1 hypothetical protein JHK82_018873 [Glycine max]
MTEFVCAENDVNLRVSTGLLAAIDKGRRRRHIVNDDLCKENLQLAGDLLNSFYCHAAIRWLAAS